MQAVDVTAAFGAEGLQSLFDLLSAQGWDLRGPRVVDGVVAVARVSHVGELPTGWVDNQEPGRYRLVQEAGEARFAWALGAQSWKPQLLPPQVASVTIRRPSVARESEVIVETPAVRPRALIGVRPCELAAIRRQDRVMAEGPVPDRDYQARRSSLFVVAVNCSRCPATCFCSSVGTGPRVAEGAALCDIEMTELVNEVGEVRYLAHPRSEVGAQVLAQLREDTAVAAASEADRAAEDAAIEATAVSQHRSLPSSLPGALSAIREHPVWDELGERCVACGNCTAVCPTCFCTRPEEWIGADGIAYRERVWDTCFGIEFSRVGGNPVRTSTTSRYRQWLTHKLDTWHDQFGESGCVGCGRCITWCPVGIDLTAEVPRLLEMEDSS